MILKHSFNKIQSNKWIMKNKILLIMDSFPMFATNINLTNHPTLPNFQSKIKI